MTAVVATPAKSIVGAATRTAKLDGTATIRTRMSVYRGLYILCLEHSGFGIHPDYELRTHAVNIDEFEGEFITLTSNFVTNMMNKNIAVDSTEYKACVAHYGNDYVELFERLCVIL